MTSQKVKTRDADPDPALQFDADPDPTFHFDADPDPDSPFLLRIQDCRPSTVPG